MRNEILYALRQTPEVDTPKYVMSPLGPHAEGVQWSPLKNAKLFSSIRDADAWVKVLDIKGTVVVSLDIHENYLIHAIGGGKWPRERAGQ